MARHLLAVATAALVLAGCQGPTTARWHDTAPDTSPSTVDLSRGRSEPVADPLYPDYGNPDVDVLHYDLALTWSPQSRRLTGTARITLRPVERIDRVVLDFSDKLRVASAKVGGRPARATTRGEDLVVPLAEPAGPDEQVVLTVEYAGTPEPVRMPSTRGDFTEGLGLRVEPDGAIWTMQEPYGAFTWYPVNDQPSDEALYDIAVTVPAGWSGVASGQFLGSRPGDGGMTYRWQSAVPVGSYVTTLAVDRFERHTDRFSGAAGTVALTYWVPDEYDEHQLAAMRRTPELLRWLEERFGPYPFGAAGAVAVDSDSAMETQMMVTMGGRIGDGMATGEAEAVYAQVLLHEYAHQWFGDAVSPRDWRGVWLNEGFATYAEGLWMVDQGQINEAEWVRWLRERDADSRKQAGPPGSYDPAKFAETNVYVGPALMLHEIRSLVGDRTFFKLCRAWVQRNLNTHQDRESFTRFVNDFTERDLTPVIDRWLDSPTTPA